MLKVILASIVSLGLSTVAFADEAGTEKAPAPTGTEAPAAPKADTTKPAKAPKGKKAHKKEHKAE